MVKTTKYFKFILIYIFILILLINFVSATSFDFYRDDGTAGTTFHVGYKGSTNNIANHVVKNRNTICYIKCTFITDQGKSGTVPGVSEGYIPAGQTSPKFSIPVVAEGDHILTTTITCEDEVSAIWCSGNKATLSKDITLSWDYCGDGKKNGPENCDGDSKDCSSINNKYYSGTIASCKSDCSGYNDDSCKFCGDGSINGGEQCDDGSNNGKSCTASYGGSCSYCSNNCKTISVKGPYCGDGQKNGPENCNNCPQDAGCSSSEQCSTSGQCINIVNDNNNCGSIGNKCDTTPKYSGGGSAYCSNDNRRAIQKGTRTWYECVGKSCQQQSSSEDDIKECGDKLCQDGHCGCNENYGPCLKTGRCEKQGSLKSNEACGCSFQCQSGYCSSQGKCMEGLNVILSSSEKAIKPGEETSVTLSVDNPFDEDIDASIVVGLTGAQVSGVISGQACSGNQCKKSVKIPARGNEDISITVQGTKEETINLIAKVTYTIDENNIEINKQEKVKVTSCGREDCTGFLNRIINRLQEIKLDIGKFSLSGLTLFAIIIILLVSGFVLRMVLHKKHHKKPTKKTEKVRSKKKKKKIELEKFNLLSLFKKIKKSKCLYCGAIIKGYHYFCPECGKKISKGKKKITVCGKCGETLKKDANYCHKCGGKSKKIKV